MTVCIWLSLDYFKRLSLCPLIAVALYLKIVSAT